MKELTAAYPDAVLRQEKKSGTTAKDRDVLNLLLDIIGKGDKLVGSKLDRLARDMLELTNLIETLNSKGAALGNAYAATKLERRSA